MLAHCEDNGGTAVARYIAEAIAPRNMEIVSSIWRKACWHARLRQSGGTRARPVAVREAIAARHSVVGRNSGDSSLCYVSCNRVSYERQRDSEVWNGHLFGSDVCD